MSSVVLSGDTSGTVTLTVPAVAGTNTVTIANQTGTLNAAGPAFSAYINPYISTTNGAFTTLACNIKEFDTNTCYNNTGSTTTLNGLSVPAYSFCPNVAGYYQINAEVEFVSNVTGCLCSIFKNNTEAKRGFYAGSSATSLAGNVSVVIYLNGTGDYVTAKCYQASGSSQNTQTGDYGTTNYFQASLVRGA